jgi:hypothetical protein
MSDKTLLKLLFEVIVRIFDIPQIQNLMREILRGIDHKVLAMKGLTEGNAWSGSIIILGFSAINCSPHFSRCSTRFDYSLMIS